jgi:hypothetical protein
MAKKRMKKSASKDMKSMGMDKSMSKDMGMKSMKMGKPMGMKMMWHHTFGKLASMAFILFVITVWPAAMQLVHSVHWGWFLGAAVLFYILHWIMCKKRMMMHM